MGNSNNKINDFFNDNKFKDIFGKIGGVFGKFGNFMGTSYFPYIIIAGVAIFIGIRTKMI